MHRQIDRCIRTYIWKNIWTHMYTCIYVCMYTNINMYIYTYIYIYKYAHAHTNTYNLYICMHMYFGPNYIYIYIFIGINWGMTSYFNSPDSVPFLSFYDRICQIPIDRDRDQLQLETIKNSTVVKVGKKRESVCKALLDISNLFLLHKQIQIFWFHTALSTNLIGRCKFPQERQIQSNISQSLKPQ